MKPPIGDFSIFLKSEEEENMPYVHPGPLWEKSEAAIPAKKEEYLIKFKTALLTELKIPLAPMGVLAHGSAHA